MSDWKDDLPEQLRDAPYIAKAESVEDALGKLQHAAKLVGTSIRIPSEDASEDDKSDFYKKLTEVPGIAQLPLSDDEEGLRALFGKLGTPTEHTEYKLPELDDFQWEEKLGENLRKYAFDAGMTTTQFNKLAIKIGEQERDSASATRTTLGDLRKELRQDWGDTLEDREALIRGWLAKSNAPDSLKESLNNQDLDLSTMNWLRAVAEQFKGDVTPVKKDGSGGDPVMTPAEAIEQIPKVINDMTAIRETDPRYEGLKEKLLELHKLAKPEQAA